ncbi:hypothetical protein [Deinococcus peraridilitoris]|uniref:Uncharacterized protein n=1 Tax=Deinococcus peraridilitoris (strain DSM 19664 / LMG 22246 / CIP 109416 / KR-200) TaxID=937777 RepID=L0A100_DEIPD|nr:hypothetical protein [Deinococcus peraridilitoris]AFZ67573.1 hypothetical protein Deipe_2077 [Deinococcus peraridilitoris DSM 19664]
MAVATEPTFSTTNATTRDIDKLLVGFKPAVSGDPIVFVQVPLISELGGFQPNSNVNRKKLYIQPDGTKRSLVNISVDGGSIQFSMASDASNATFKNLLNAASKGQPVVYKAVYASANIQVWGESAIQDRGMQGGAQDFPDWAFTLETLSSQYVDMAGNTLS